MEFLKFKLFVIVFLQMKSVHEAMKNRSDQNGNHTQECNTAEDGIKGSEKFCIVICQRIDRTHACKNHGCVQKRIDPMESTQPMITGRSDEKRNAEKNQDEQYIP